MTAPSLGFSEHPFADSANFCSENPKGEDPKGGDPEGGNPKGRDLALQVMWNRLISVVEEQALSLVRTAFSTSVREAGDLSAGVFDTEGRMMAQAVTGTPGHVNTMAAAVDHFIEGIGPHRIYPGDVYLTNDPWKGTGHLHDITVVTPVFRADRLIAYFGATAHVVDIGGRGFGPDASEIYEEGLFIPVMKLAERGRLNRDLIAVIRANVREPDQVVGDVHSLAACNDTGIQRLGDMLDELGLDDVEPIASFIFDRTAAAVRAAVERVPPGAYTNAMDVDGYNRTISLAVELEVGGGRIHADFAGTSPVSSHGINVPIAYSRAYMTYGLLCALAPGTPNNAASLAPFTVSAPAGCILNARPPDPVSVRHVIGHFVTDLCLGALAEVLPDVVPAEGSGALWNFQAGARAVGAPVGGASGNGASGNGALGGGASGGGAPVGGASGDGAPGDNGALADGAGTHGGAAEDGGGRDRPPAEILMFNSGGTGARPRLDGLSATAFPSGVRTMSVEATEQVGPIVIWRKELRPDSGGAGMHRGGLGQVIELGPAEGYELHFSAMFDRVENPARGRRGGGDGAAGRVSMDDGSPFDAKGKQLVPAGRRLIFELPGGGGWGDSARRSPEAVRDDLAQGYVTDPGRDHDEAAAVIGPEGRDGNGDGAVTGSEDTVTGPEA